ncbi:hypothetical protein D3C81_753430 [compost metagenome]
MDDLICMVPRNLNKPDTIIHFPFKLNWKQISYLGLGIGGTYLSFQTFLPISIKIGLSIGSFGLGVISAAIKYKGSTVDELALDAITFTQRKIYFNNLKGRGDLIVTISCREEKTTVTGIKSKILSFPTS